MAKYFSYAQMTMYPKLFKDTYWGMFSTEKRSEEDIEKLKSICENRNEFVETYDIEKWMYKGLKYISRFLRELENENKDIRFDHTELYKLNNGSFLLLNSPYGNNDQCLEKGWKKEKELYNGAFSYSKIFKLEDIKKVKTNKETLHDFYKNHTDYFDKIKCPICDQEYTKNNKSKHMKTKIHLVCASKLN